MQFNLENKIDEATSLIHRFVDLDEVARTHVSLSSMPAVNGGGHRDEGGIVRSIL